MKAFSLIELIFVIVIMGILSFVGIQYIPDEKLTVYTQMLKAKILEKKSNALGYRYTGENNLTCITFNKDWLTLDENNSKVKYDFNKTYITNINVFPQLNDNRLCFDYLGREFNGSVDENLASLIHYDIIITLKGEKNKEENITIYPISGMVR
jgi:prepilin-type N-terminal cleavage/methylation domain-containing protein